MVALVVRVIRAKFSATRDTQHQGMAATKLQHSHACHLELSSRLAASQTRATRTRFRTLSQAQIAQAKPPIHATTAVASQALQILETATHSVFHAELLRSLHAPPIPALNSRLPTAITPRAVHAREP